MLIALLIALSVGPGQARPDPVAAAVGAQVQTYALTRPSPGIHLSPRAAAAYALTSGCLPAVVTGRPAREFFSTTVSRGPDETGRHMVSRAVYLIEQPHGCTVTSSRGDPDQLREAVLESLDRLGARRTVVSDSGAGSRDSGGPFRQELHCVTVDGTALYLVMSTSSASNRHPLMATLGRDSDGPCARPSQ